MECTSNAVVVPLDAGWWDIGSWAGLAEVSQRDEAGNVIRGDAVVHDTRDSIVLGGGRLVTVIGAKDLIIVDTPDAVLVSDRDAAREVKAVVQELERNDRRELKLLPQGPSTLGELRLGTRWSRIQRQAPYRSAGSEAFPAGPPPPRGTLGRGARNSSGDAG